MIFANRALNFGFLRLRSTASIKDCLTISLRLVPSTLASASASAANSSGSRTVRFFDLVSCYQETIFVRATCANERKTGRISV